MKKRIIVVLLIAVLSLPVFASSYTGFGMGGLYNSAFNTGEMDFYLNYSYLLPTSETMELGIGTRCDTSFSIPFDTFSVAILTGYQMNVSIRNNLELAVILGPHFICSVPNKGSSIIAFGGSVDLSLTLYIDEYKRVGFTVGTINHLSAIIDAPTTHFGYFGGGYCGITIRFPNPLYGPLPPGFAYIWL